MNFTRLYISALVLSIVTACGGAGGDSGPVVDNVAIEAVSKYVGLWDLPGNWRDETSDDEAVLAIRSPDTAGEAKAIIYDFDDAIGGMGNCYLLDSEGILMKSLEDDTIFLTLSPVYDSAIAELQPNGELEISVLEAGSGTEPARVLTATFRGPVTTENDLNICAP